MGWIRDNESIYIIYVVFLAPRGIMVRPFNIFLVFVHSANNPLVHANAGEETGPRLPWWAFGIYQVM